MEHYYSEHPKSLLNLKKIRHRIRDCDFEFYTGSAVFSKKRIDRGTIILADNFIIDEHSKVLDIGCGIGVLGIVAARLIGAKVVMTDINSRAVMLAKKNVVLNKVNALVMHGNLYDAINDHDFDVILSNPPQNAGKKICFQLIDESRQYLKDGASLQIVARQNKGGKTLSNRMKDVFGNVATVAKKSGYSVYLSKN